MALVKATIQRRIELPEVYDCVDMAATIAIRSQSTSVRSQATSLSMTFLLNYPMSKRRLRQHLDFYIRNLDFDHVDGRIASLDAIKGTPELHRHRSTLGLAMPT